MATDREAPLFYDEIYRQTKHTFGAAPEATLQAHWRTLDKTRPVLDIGAGQGRNALFLARMGFTVDAIDPSTVAVETIATLAAQERLSLRAHACGFDDFSPATPDYGGILVFGLIQILSWEEIERLRVRLRQWTGPGSLLFLTGFGVAEGARVRQSPDWKPSGRNSYVDGQDRRRTYLEAGEIRGLFCDFEVLHHWEGQGPEHRHGDGAPESHAMVEIVLRRKPAARNEEGCDV